MYGRPSGRCTRWARGVAHPSAKNRVVGERNHVEVIKMYALVFGTRSCGRPTLSDGGIQFRAGRFRQMELLSESVLAQSDGAPR